MHTELLIASNNAGKCKEIQLALQDLAITIYTLSDWAAKNNLQNIPDPIEDGSTYYENALIKAKECAEWGGIATVADDSGIEVAALNGEPGLYSARYAGENVTYADNYNKMLRELEGVEDRRAKFLCTILLYDPKTNQAESFEGILPGAITTECSEEKGFGYDPIFQPDGCQQTLAEAKAENPDFPTHRNLALEQLKNYLS